MYVKSLLEFTLAYFTVAAHTYSGELDCAHWLVVPFKRMKLIQKTKQVLSGNVVEETW